MLDSVEAIKLMLTAFAWWELVAGALFFYLLAVSFDELAKDKSMKKILYIDGNPDDGLTFWGYLYGLLIVLSFVFSAIFAVVFVYKLLAVAYASFAPAITSFVKALHYASWLDLAVGIATPFAAASIAAYITFETDWGKSAFGRALGIAATVFLLLVSITFALEVFGRVMLKLVVYFSGGGA